ncbi:hypothetical protein FQN60_004445, partial [Etheostoma spectabile]
MDFYINLKVNFRGNSKNFLLSGSETKSWESMEAMVKRSFGLSSLQLTYFDEENEESAARQGNRLHMNVYETRGQPARVPTTKASGTEPKRGFRPPQPCPTLAQVVSRKVQAAVPEQGMVIMKDVKGAKEEDKTPPAWFTSYMEKICREFSGQCCIHKPLGGGGAGGGGGRGDAVGGAEAQQVPECVYVLYSVRALQFLSRSQSQPGESPDSSAEKQRLKAEKRLLKAEVKEIRKQLRMERRGVQWSSSHRDGSSSPVLLQPRATQHSSPERPKRPCPLVVPAMTAAFLDENLPDGTRLRPGTKFIKGPLEGSVRSLPSARTVSVALCAPTVDGSYTSHWRLAHAGEQFGPRVWCSIVVDPLAPAPMMADGILVSPCVTPQLTVLDGEQLADGGPPSLGRAQSLRNIKYMTPCMSPLPRHGPLQDKSSPSLGLIQEETEVINSIMDVPHGAGSGGEGGGVPAQEEGEDDISGTQFVCETVIRSLTLEEPLDHAPLRGPRPGKGTVVRPAAQGGSSSSSPCVKSRTVKAEESPDSSPSTSEKHLNAAATLQASLPPLLKVSLPAPLSGTPAPGPGPSSAPTLLLSPPSSTQQEHTTTGDSRKQMVKERETGPEEEKEKDGEKRERTRSRSSSTSSEDYIIILPDCFDTSRPLGESMYSSALSQPGDIPAKTPTDPETPSPDHPGTSPPEGELGEADEAAAASGTGVSGASSANDMLCTSQTLDDEPLTPEVVAPPKATVTPSPGSSGETDVDPDAAGEGAEGSELYQTED